MGASDLDGPPSEEVGRDLESELHLGTSAVQGDLNPGRNWDKKRQHILDS